MFDDVLVVFLLQSPARRHIRFDSYKVFITRMSLFLAPTALLSLLTWMRYYYILCSGAPCSIIVDLSSLV